MLDGISVINIVLYNKAVAVSMTWHDMNFDLLGQGQGVL